MHVSRLLRITWVYICHYVCAYRQPLSKVPEPCYCSPAISLFRSCGQNILQRVVMSSQTLIEISERCQSRRRSVFFTHTSPSREPGMLIRFPMLKHTE
jgi:hypothetical protein